MSDDHLWEQGLSKTPMGGLSALSFPNGKFITYTRNSDSYEMLLTNFVDGTDGAWLDFYVERPSAVGVALVHPRDGLAYNGVDWDDREEDFGDEVHVVVGDENKDGDEAPFAVFSMPREAAKQLADDINYMLQISEKGK